MRTTKMWGKFVLIILCCFCAEFTYASQPYVFGRADFPTGSGPSAMATADFNGDGNPDLAVINFFDRTVSVFFGKSDGSLVKSADYAVATDFSTNPLAIAAGDFNGDGKPDLVVAVGQQSCHCYGKAGSVSVLLNKGDGTFQESVLYNPGINPVSIVAGDFNGDGKLDFAVANSGYPLEPGTVSIFLNKGDGTFRHSGDYAAGLGVGELTTVNFGSNGKLSLVVINYVSQETNGISVLRNKGDGTFQAPVSYLMGKDPGWVVSADFNNDGEPDLAVTTGFNTLAILLGRQDGTFANEVDYSVANGPNQVVVGDFDGNHKLDLAVTASTGGGRGGAVSILLGKGDGTFQSSVTYGTGNNPQSIVAADFNHDGWQDLAFTNADVNRVSVLLGKGDGTFPSYRDYPSGQTPIAIAVGDFNGDGLLDLVVVNNSVSTISILFGESGGRFVLKHTYAVGSNPSSVAVADLNGDHRPDLVVASAGDNTVSILLNKGHGTFTSTSTYSVGINPSSVAVADFNGHGNPDLVVANAGDDTVSVLLNDGNGRFHQSATYSTGPGPVFVIAVDLNGDGKPDLAVADGAAFPGLVSVLLNNGDGAFATKIDYGAGGYPTSLVAGDFNGDGKLDLAVATTFTDKNLGLVAVLIGNGDGTLQPQVDYFEGINISSLVAADFNGDSKLDLAVVSNGNSTVFILAGRGNGEFDVQGTYGAGIAPWAVAAGNFVRKAHGVGEADLVVTDFVSDSVSVFLNTPWHRRH